MAEEPMAEAVAAAENMQNNNEDGQQQQQAGGAADDILFLESIDDYIRNRGIHIGLPPEHDHQADAYFEDADHAARRVEAGKLHQDAVHKSAFAKHDEKEIDAKVERERLLKSLEGKSIVITTADGGITRSVPLDILASSCDTIMQMVKSRPAFEGNKRPDTEKYRLDLQHFPLSSVESFLDVVVSGKSVSAISEDHIVDVTQISHYVQCASVLEECLEIMKSSIDSDNCLSICHLADTLGAPSLFEASVGHLINRLDDMQDHEHWDDFPIPLRNRIITMRNAVHSSILGRGQKTSIFFSSSDEFLAIFSDNVREQRERLAEAKKRQDEIISERIRKGGRHRDPYGGSVKDAAEKIERQEKRLQTLESFYKEQKMIFASGNGANGDGSSFQLGYS